MNCKRNKTSNAFKIQMLFLAIHVETKKAIYAKVLFITLGDYVWLSIYERMNPKPTFCGFYKVHKVNLSYLVKIGSTSLKI